MLKKDNERNANGMYIIGVPTLQLPLLNVPFTNSIFI